MADATGKDTIDSRNDALLVLDRGLKEPDTSGGGFIFSDDHGEPPWQVPEEILDAISDAVQGWGKYPLAWARQNDS